MNSVEINLPTCPYKLAGKAQYLIEKLSTNPYFPNTRPSVAILAAQKDILENWLGKGAVAETNGLNNLKAAIENLRSTISALGSYINSGAAGNAEMILSTGFELKSDSPQSVTLDSPKNVQIQKAKLEGSVTIEWAKTEGAYVYIVQMSTTNPDKHEPVWITVHVTSRNKVNIAHLIHSKCYYFRVKRANNAIESRYSEVFRFCAV